MKNLYVILLTTLCSGTLAQNTFLRTYNYGSDKIFNVVTTPDSGFAVLTRESILGFRLCKYDSQGKEVWNKTYDNGDNNFDHSKGFITTSDNGFFIYGNENGTNSYFFKCDSFGQPVWSQSFDQHYDFWASTAFETSSQDYIVTQHLNGSGFDGVQISMFSYSGSLKWSSILRNINYSDINTKIVQLGTNQFLFFGQSDHPTNNSVDILVCSFDSTGVINWSKIYGGPAEDKFIDAELADDGNIIVAGYTSSYGNGDENILLMQIDSTGTSHWLSTIGSNINERPNDLELGSDMIYVCGFKGSVLTGKAPIMIGADYSGNFLWSKEVLSQDGEALSIKRTIDDKLITSGIFSYPNTEKGFLLKTNNYGSSSCTGKSVFLSRQFVTPNVQAVSITQLPRTDTTSLNTYVSLSSGSLNDSCQYNCMVNAKVNFLKYVGCQNDSIQYQNLSTGANSFKWYVNGNLIDSSYNFTYSFDTVGTHRVDLVAWDSVCTDTATTYIEINPVPQADFTYNRKMLVLKFSNHSAHATSYSWDFGDGTFSSEVNPTHIYDDVGTFNVCLSAINGCDTQNFCQQIIIQDTLGVSFQRSYNPSNLSGPQHAKDVAVTKQGDYMILGYDDHFRNNFDIYLAKVNQKGEPLWSKVIGSSGDQVGRAIQATNDQGFAIVGYNGQGTKAFVLKVDSITNTEWMVFFEIWNNTGFYDVIQADNLDYIVTGTVKNKLAVARISPTGNVIWANQYNAAYKGLDIIEKDNGELLVVGQTSMSNSDIYVATLQSTGQIVWAKTIGGPNDDYAVEVIPEGNNQFYITGSTSSYGSGTYDICILKISQTGSILYQKAMGTVASEYATGLINNRNGDKFVTFNNSWGGGNVLKFNSNFSTLYWNYNVSNIALGYDSHKPVLTYDDGIVWPTYSLLPSYARRPMLMKFTATGGSGAICHSSQPNLYFTNTSFTSTNSSSTNITAITEDPGGSYFLVNNLPLKDSNYCYHDNYCSPTANFTFNINDTVASFTDSSVLATSWLWSFGDGDSSSLQNPAHIYKSSGNYNVCLTTSNICGSEVICKSLQVNCPQATAQYSYITNNKGQIIISDSSSLATSWHWDFGDGNTSSIANPTHQYSGSGIYEMCLISSNSCSSDTLCDSVAITCPPTSAYFSYNDSLLSVAFTDTSVGANSFYWEFGDGDTSTLKNPTHTYSMPGRYNVCLTINGYCTDSTFCDTIEVTCPKPQSGFTMVVDTMLNASFSDTSKNASQWLWNFGDGNNSTKQNPTHQYSSSGYYEVCLVTTNSCGSDTVCDSILLSVISIDFDKKLDNSIYIYPNPATYKATLEVFNKELISPLHIKVYSYDLKLIQSIYLDKRRQVVLDCNNLPNGYYNVIIQDVDGRVVNVPLLLH